MTEQHVSSWARFHEESGLHDDGRGLRRHMGDEDLREVIETNFKLLSMSMRDASVRAGRIEESLDQTRKGLEAVKALSGENRQ